MAKYDNRIFIVGLRCVDKLKALAISSKIITIIVTVNVFIIGVYILHGANISSTFVTAQFDLTSRTTTMRLKSTGFERSRNTDDDNNDNNKFAKSSTFGSEKYVFLTKVDGNVNVDDDNRNVEKEEKSRTTNYENIYSDNDIMGKRSRRKKLRLVNNFYQQNTMVDSEKGDEKVLWASTIPRQINLKDQYDDNTDDYDDDESDDDDDDINTLMNDEDNTSSFVYSRAFPKQRMPSSLLNWKPSPDVERYFQPIDNSGDNGWIFSAYYSPGSITTTLSSPSTPSSSTVMDQLTKSITTDAFATSSSQNSFDVSENRIDDYEYHTPNNIDVGDGAEAETGDNIDDHENDEHDNDQDIHDNKSVDYEDEIATNDGKITENTIRAFVILKRTRPSPKVYCHFYDENKVRLGRKKGRKYPLKAGHGTLYSSMYIECPLPKDVIPFQSHYLSLTFQPRPKHPPINQITIKYSGTPLRNFTVCFSPLHSNFNLTNSLVEAIELNSLLGADHFFVYNFSISPQVDRILRSYETNGLLTIIQWPLPNLHLWYYGQTLAVNDCIYRNSGTSKFVVITDTDEFIIPQIHTNWLDMISNLNSVPSFRDDAYLNDYLREINTRPLDRRKKIHTTSHLIQPVSSQPYPSSSFFGAWSFRSSFFPDRVTNINKLIEYGYSFTAEQKRILMKFPSRAILSVNRLKRVYRHGKRSKLIVRPECVNIGGVHIIPDIRKECAMALVSFRVALLQHYRPHHDKTGTQLQFSALRFKNGFLSRLKRVLVKFPDVLFTK